MAIFVEKADEILQRAIDRLRENTQITRFTPGSKARTLLEIMSQEMEKHDESLKTNLVLGLSNGATGIFLDFIGDLVAQPRNLTKTARVSAAEETLKVTVPGGGIFGSLNNNVAFVIPSDTLITSLDGTIIYRTTEAITLSPLDTEAFLSARADEIGSTGNVGQGVLTVLDFSGYVTFPEIQLEVTNLSAIERGENVESDDLYRFRIRNALISAEAANETAIRLALLSLPSVSDIIFLEFFRGVGTADVLLDTVTGSFNSTITEEAQRTINGVQALGMSVRARIPRLIGLELFLDVKYQRGTTELQKDEVDDNIRSAVLDVIGQVEIAGQLRLNGLAAIIFGADSRIADIGLPNRPITDVVLWRESDAVGIRVPYPTIPNSNIQLAFDEKLVIEGSLIAGINITRV